MVAGVGYCDSLYYELLIRLNKFHVSCSALSRRWQPCCPDDRGVLSPRVDLLIPAIDKDLAVLPLVIQSLQKHLCHEIGSVLVVGNSAAVRGAVEGLGCTYVDENTVLPIKKVDVRFSARGKDRSGWIFQQLIKLYGDHLCDTENFLVADADTILIRPTRFMLDGVPVLYYSDEFNVTYYRNFEKLFGRKVRSVRSFVAHMMLLNRTMLTSLRQDIEEGDSKPWYSVILDSLEPDHPVPFSEFECYANYFRQARPGQAVLRHFRNLSLPAETVKLGLDTLESRYVNTYRSLSFHTYP